MRATCENWRVALLTYILAYSSTPHTVTGISPTTLMLGRAVHSKLNDFCLHTSDNLGEGVRET